MGSKISWNQAHAAVAYCAEHNINYSNETTIPNTFKSGLKKNLRTPNGMIYHVPPPNKSWSRQEKDMRAYLYWYGESMDEIIESLAFLRVLTQRTLVLVRSKTSLTEEEK